MVTKGKIMVVLMLVFGIVAVTGLGASSANAQSANTATCVQCYAPVNASNVPVVTNSGNQQVLCSTCVPVASAQPAAPVCPTPLRVVGSIIEFPFTLAQCILGQCPQS